MPGAIPDPNDAAWIARATRIDDFTVDSLFLVTTRIQFCDAVTVRIVPGEEAFLPTPDMMFAQPDWVTASSLHGREDAL